jgi:hypothetical protein
VEALCHNVAQTYIGFDKCAVAQNGKFHSILCKLRSQFVIVLLSLQCAASLRESPCPKQSLHSTTTNTRPSAMSPSQLFVAVALGALVSVASPVSLNTFSILSDAQVSAFKPFTFFASAAYCPPSATLTWSCGSAINPVPDIWHATK